MSFWEKFKLLFARLMSGRYGADELGMAMVIAGLVLNLIDRFVGLGLPSLLGMVLYVLALYRMFSRNLDKRAAENAKYNQFFATLRTKLRQFIVRQKNRKEYKYFRCPGCRSLMRLKRGTGEKHIVCPKCRREFDQKA